MKRIPHVKLTEHEFIMLRSLDKESWQSTDPVLWRFNRDWRLNHALIKVARPAAEQLWKRGLIDAVPLKGFSPLNPGETVKWYSLNKRGAALLARANACNMPHHGHPKATSPHYVTMRPGGSIWARLLHSLRRRRGQTPSSQVNEAGDRK